MSKDALTDYSATNSSNTDVGGVPIQGTNNVSYFDNGLRELMTHLADAMAGTSPLSDGLKIGYASDLTANIQFDCSSITTGTTRTIALPDANVTIPSGTLADTSSTQTFTNKSFGDAVSISSSATGELLTVTSTDAGATGGPTLNLYRNSASPAASDNIGAISFTGEDSAGNAQTYAYLYGQIGDPTSTSEDGLLGINTAVAGTTASRLFVGGGLYTSGVTGGDKGAGTINATTLYQAGVAVPFTAGFTSSNQALSTSIDVAHGLGAVPAIVRAVLVCTTTDAGYSVGDEITYGGSPYDAGYTNHGVYADATYVGYRSSGSGYAVPNKSTGATATLTNSSWRMKFYAYV